MDKFWKTPEGKILSYGIHEHSGGIGLIYNNLLFIKRQIENKHIELVGEEQQVKYFNQCLNSAIESKDRCNKAVDYIYTEIKKLKENEKM